MGNGLKSNLKKSTLRGDNEVLINTVLKLKTMISVLKKNQDKLIENQGRLIDALVIKHSDTEDLKEGGDYDVGSAEKESVKSS